MDQAFWLERKETEIWDKVGYGKFWRWLNKVEFEV